MKTKKTIITPILLETLKKDKANLRKSISALKKSMTEYKAERKTEWKSYKTKFNSDLDTIESSLKKLVVIHKKQQNHVSV